MSAPQYAFDAPGNPNSERNPNARLVVPLLCFLTVAVGFLMAERFSRRRLTPEEVIRPVTPRGDLAADEKATIDLFQQSSRSVVHITTLVTSRRVFTTDLTARQSGTGSGFVWDESGHVVTNFHVVAGSTDFLVTFADQRTVSAKPVGVAPHKDLAVLRVDLSAEDLSPIIVGESSDLQVGQKVFAIGNPFGLDQTLTTGVISGLGREIQSPHAERKISDVVQTDAAINPGNSGGPLLDSAGRLIGVNTAIVSGSGASDGVGFAIPVDTVRRVVPQLILHTRVITPTLGIGIFDPNATRRAGLKGVLVRSLQPGGPADVAGIEPFRYDRYRQLVYGDLIVGLDQAPVDEIDDLYKFLESKSVGDRVEVHVLRAANTRSAQRLTVPVTLGSDQ